MYDKANRLSAQHWEIQGDSYEESYTYDADDGSLQSMTTAGGQTLSYTYDFLKRHSATTVKNGSSTIFTVAKSYYNQTTDTTLTTAQVQYYNVRNSAGTLIAGSQYVYDARGNITQIKESEGPYRLLVAYEYDSLNQLTKETVYTYTGTSTTASSTTVNTFTYDTAGNLLTVSENGVVKDTYTYGNSDWVDLLTKFNGTSISYDASGNPLNWYNGNTYSGLSWVMGRQLESMTVETDTEELGISYSYDMSGMRSGKTVVVGAGTGGGDEGGIVVPGCDHEWVEINRTEYHIFYQCTKCSSTYQEPIQAPPTEYSLRSSSPTEHHEYIYASGKLLREIITTTSGTTTSTEVLDFVYGSGGTPLALVYTNGTASPVTYYYVTNIQGDVVKLVNASGTVVAEYAYDAWGKVISATGSMAEVNPIRYRGYYYDAETELYYLQSRYYDPAVRRFVNADGIASTGQGFLGYNAFAYCNNNPANAYDPSGYAAVWTSQVAICDGGTPIYVVSVVENPPFEYPTLIPSSQDLYAYLYGHHKIPRIEDGIPEVNLTIFRHAELFDYSSSMDAQDWIGLAATGYGLFEATVTLFGITKLSYFLSPLAGAAVSVGGLVISAIPGLPEGPDGQYLAFTVDCERVYRTSGPDGDTIIRERRISTYLWYSVEQFWFEAGRVTVYSEFVPPSSP